MSVTTENNRTSELTTDGVVTDFDFDMLIHAKSEVEVYHKPTGGRYDQLTLDSDYGVVFTEDGGTVSTDGYTAPLAAGKLLIIRHLALTQNTNWLHNDNHSEQQHQDDFDRASAMKPIQLWEYIQRAPKFPIHSSTKNITFPEPSANQILGWNAGGDDLANISPSAIAVLVAEEIELGDVPENLTDLADATITAPVDGDLLRYDGAAWVNDPYTNIDHDQLTNVHQDVNTTASPDFASGVTIGTLTLADGSITDSGGTIDFGNENLETAGHIKASDDLIGSLLNLFDGTGESYYLKIAAGGIPGGVALTANRILAIEVNNAARVITFSGDPTLADWFDQSVKAAADVAFNSINIADWLITGGDIDASGSVAGTSLVTDGDIGTAADPNLLQCAVDALTVNGTLTATGKGAFESLDIVSALSDSGFQFGYKATGTVESSDNSVYSMWMNQTLTPANAKWAIGLYGGGVIGVASPDNVSGTSVYASAMTKDGDGTIGTLYGVYIAHPTAGVTNYALYSAGGDNYFGGDVAIAAILAVDTINEDAVNVGVTVDSVVLKDGGITLPTTSEINFRDTDISMGSTLADGILDMSADGSIRMFYDNTDVGDAVSGQSFYVYRRAEEGDDYIRFYINSAKSAVINTTGSILYYQIGGTWKTYLTASGLFSAVDINVSSGKVYKVNTVQVIGAQGAAVADATDADDVILRLNDLLARVRAHGLIAT